MNVASLELSKELYELSGWNETHSAYEQTAGISLGEPYIVHPELERRYGLWSTQELKVRTPAYDLSYLLRKLVDLGFHISLQKSPGDGWVTEALDERSRLSRSTVMRSSPEDALAWLVIILFKNGVLTRGGDA